MTVKLTNVLTYGSTLADIYHRTASVVQKVLIYYVGTKLDSEMNNTSFESPISELPPNSQI